MSFANSPMPAQIIQLKWIYGLNTQLKNHLFYVSERLFYPAGYHIVAYSPKQKSQNYFSGAQDYRGFSCFAMHPLKKLLVMGLKSEIKPMLYFHEIAHSSKKKRLEFNQITVKEWTAICFNPNTVLIYYQDSKQFVAFGINQPCIVYFSPEKNKALGYLLINGANDVNQISFSPDVESGQPQLISILGKNTFKLLRLHLQQDKNFEFSIMCNQINFPVGIQNPPNYNTHVWIKDYQRLVVASTHDILLIDQKGNFIQYIHINQWKHKQNSIEHLIYWENGFIAGGPLGLAFFQFELTTFKLIFIKSKELDYGVKCMFLSQDRLYFTTNNNVIMTCRLKQGVQTKDIQKIEQVTLSMHSAAITSMDLCIRKPLIATASKDKCLKIWNFQEKTVETHKNESQPPNYLSMHPSGFHLAVAYADKLKLLNIQKDGSSLHPFKQISPFKNCFEIKFSNGGQYFAAVSVSVIHIFKFYTCQNPPSLTFKDLGAKIKSLAWSKNDNILVSLGIDGSIFAYKVGLQNCGTRVISCHLNKQEKIKQMTYFSIAIANDGTGSKIYSVGATSSNQRVVKQITLSDGIQTKKDIGNAIVTTIALPSNARIMIAGVDDKQRAGSIKCYKFPISQQVQEFAAHDERGIDRIKITADDKYAVSAGKDGCLMIWQIKDKQNQAQRMKESFGYSNEILITKADLQILKNQEDTYKQEWQELQGSAGMINGIGKDQNIKQLQEKMANQIHQHNQNMKKLIEEKKRNQHKFEEQIKSIQQTLTSDLQVFDTSQSRLVMQANAKYDEQKRKLELDTQTQERTKNNLEEKHKKILQEIDETYKSKIETQKARRQQIQMNIEKSKKMHQETMKQIMQQKIQEIRNLQSKNAQIVQQLNQKSHKAKNQMAATKKNIQGFKKDLQAIKDQKNDDTNQIAHLRNANAQLENQINAMDKIIRERDKTIAENQKKIYELKKRSQQLQKFKYVLDHKIKELKLDIGPREEKLNKLKQDTNKLDQALKKYNTDNSKLAQVVGELYKAEGIMKKQIAKQNARISYQATHIKQFKDKLFQSVQFIQNQEQLRARAIELHQEFVKSVVSAVQIDNNIDQEYKNQRKFLYKSIEQLSNNLKKDKEMHHHNYVKQMKANVDLIKDITKLRTDIKQLNKQPLLNQRKKKNPMNIEQVKKKYQQKLMQRRILEKQIDQIRNRLAFYQ